MKLVALITCYNSADYLEHVIRSALTWVDDVMIVEGAFQIAVDAGCPHRSTDDTIKILDKYSHLKNVFVYKPPTPLSEHRVQYDWALQHAKRDCQPDWAIMIDSDEIYPETTQKIIRNTLNRNSENIFGYRVHSYNFINDFKHYYDGVYPRIFRVTPHCRFVYDNEVMWPDYDKMGDKMGWPPPNYIGVINDRFRFFHYAYVKDHKYLEKKAAWMYNKDKNPAYDPSKPQYRVEGNKYKIPDGIEIKEFDGEHPPIMKDHPYNTREF